MFIMNNKDDFKNNNQFVYVEGEPCGLVIPRGKSMYDKDYRTDLLRYEGYIEVPYSYDAFNSFSLQQQLAICQATMIKSGLCFKLDKCDLNAFYEKE